MANTRVGLDWMETIIFATISYENIQLNGKSIICNPHSQKEKLPRLHKVLYR